MGLKLNVAQLGLAFRLLSVFRSSRSLRIAPACASFEAASLGRMRLNIGLTVSSLSWREVKRDSGFCEV